MEIKQSFVYVEQNGNSVGLFRSHEDAKIMIAEILTGDFGLSEVQAKKVFADNQEDQYSIYYDEVNLYEKSESE